MAEPLPSLPLRLRFLFPLLGAGWCWGFQYSAPLLDKRISSRPVHLAVEATLREESAPLFLLYYAHSLLPRLLEPSAEPRGYLSLKVLGSLEFASYRESHLPLELSECHNIAEHEDIRPLPRCSELASSLSSSLETSLRCGEENGLVQAPGYASSRLRPNRCALAA